MAGIFVLTEKSVINCKHGGRVNVTAAQRFVTIAGEAVLSFPDPTPKPISGCPNISSSSKPCTSTTSTLKGFSSFVTMNGRNIVNADLDGLTDGTPPAAVHYSMTSALQTFVYVDRG